MTRRQRINQIDGTKKIWHFMCIYFNLRLTQQKRLLSIMCVLCITKWEKTLFFLKEKIARWNYANFIIHHNICALCLSHSVSKDFNRSSQYTRERQPQKCYFRVTTFSSIFQNKKKHIDEWLHKTFPIPMTKLGK